MIVAVACWIRADLLRPDPVGQPSTGRVAGEAGQGDGRQRQAGQLDVDPPHPAEVDEEERQHQFDHLGQVLFQAAAAAVDDAAVADALRQVAAEDRALSPWCGPAAVRAREG